MPGGVGDMDGIEVDTTATSSVDDDIIVLVGITAVSLFTATNMKRIYIIRVKRIICFALWRCCNLDYKCSQK